MNDSSLEILINVPLKHPELNAIKYQADSKIVALEFALQAVPDEAEIQEFYNKVHKACKTYAKLFNKPAKIFDISFEQKEELTLLTLYRDEDSLCEEEADIFITFLREDFAGCLIKDKIDIDKNESYKKRLKRNILHRISDKKCSSLWAFRQSGKVFVLNK